MTRLALTVFALAFSSCALCAPRAAKNDVPAEGSVRNIAAPKVEREDRIQIVDYDVLQVYKAYAAVGKAMLIQFGEGETVDLDETVKANEKTGMGMGFGSAWQLTARANNFFMKPKDKQPDTNMLVVTNKHTYSFDLAMAPAGMRPTYAMIFRYPEEEKRKFEEAAARDRQAATSAKAVAAQVAAALAERDRVTAEAKAKPVRINTNYVWKGKDGALAPTAMWDDGRFTHLQYNHGGAVPVFYKVLSDGSEALVNSNIDPDDKTTTIIHEVVAVLRARLNDSVIEITNKAYRVPEFNEFGTSVHGAVRVDKPTEPSAK